MKKVEEWQVCMNQMKLTMKRECSPENLGNKNW